MSDTYEQLKLKNQLCFPLYACSRKIVNAYTPYLKPLGLTYTQYLVFMVLWEKKEATVGELGSTLYLDAGTLSPLLKKLEIEGLIARTHPENDERVTSVKLTDKGEELKEACKDIPFNVASVVGSFDKKEIEQLYGLLYKILDQ
ncbi:MAG: MarR family transcriptional regulator [Lachnospiraceae bacterium]|jgi:DNA-binding MarR family transcriptional regulator|nr:MarR family transcriptional regulator [Lachnospiraceae bacterium]